MATASDTAAPDGVGGPSVRHIAEAGQGELAVGRWDPGAEEPSKSDRYLARRLAAASADYKSVACTTFLLGAAVAGGIWLIVGVVAEHWLVPGGLSPAIRWAWLGTALVALAAAAVRWLVPLVRYRVNLVYAARAIEREHPELHNDLVNTVLVKAHRESNREKVVRSLERRTAKQLAEVPVEAVIDRTVPLRLTWVLAALVGLAGVYELAAPKSLLVTTARLLAPWVGWAAPSRVRIETPRLAWRMPAEEGPAADALDRRGLAVEAGSTTLVRGRQLVVAADIRGLRRGERPEVVVAPLRADGRIDPTVPAWKAELAPAQAASGSGRTFVTALPDAIRGLDHSVEITIAAGDARTAPVRVSVVDSPTLLVREIRYVFPAYTGRAPETVAWQGDIRALEGTEVTVVAESNQPLEDAWIDFDGNGGRDLKFLKSAADHARVTKTFHLRLNADGTGPEHASYRLLFQPRSTGAVGRDQVITDPLEHRIEVLPDVAPEVAIDDPRESPLRVPPAAPVMVRVQALDPDFAVVRVAIETRLQGGAAGREIPILEREHAGVFRGAARLVPERLGAGPGTVLEYRAVAIDNRPKQPNVSRSPWQALKIDASAPPRQPEPPPSGRQPANGDPSDGQGGEQGQAGGEGGHGRDGNADQELGKQPNQPDENQAQPQAADRRPGDQQEQNRERQQRDQPQPGNEKQEGKQDGRAQGAQGGDRQQQPNDGKQAGKQQGEGRNQGQGADRGQGLGAQGERQGGAEQQAGKEQPGGKEQPAGKEQDGRNDRGQQGGRKDGQPQAGQQRGNDGRQAGGARDKAVAADGTNDGEALERILEHRREQGEKGGEKGGGSGRPGTDAGGGDQKEKEGADAAGAKGGEKGAGTEGAGQKGGGKESEGQAGAESAAGKDDVGKETAGRSGAGKQGPRKSAAEGGSEAGEQSTDGEREGAAGEGQQAAGSKQGSREGPGQPPRDQHAGSKTGGQPGNGDQRADAGDKASAQPGQPGNGGGQTGSGGWAGGDAARRPDDAPVPDGPPPSRETEWGEQDLAHARNAAGLAVEHLRKAVESGDTAVLDRLGWTRDQARAFLDRWEKMRRLAESADPVERGAFDRTMRSLGLRPDGVRSSRDVPADPRGGQAEGRRSRPPADYQEQVKAYTQGTSGE